jgi:general secretion pathway protein F
MPTFTYKARDRKGEAISGTMEAETSETVVSRLQSMDYFPLSIADQSGVREQGLQGLRKKLGRRRVGVADLATLNRQLADLISSGIPMVKALEIVGDQTSHPFLNEALERIVADVSGGDTLAEAMSHHPRIFTPLTVAMISAGETGGMLDTVLQRLADFSETDAEIRSKVKSALAYPAVMVGVGTAAIAVLVTVVIPKIVGIFTELGQALPWPTLVLINVTGFLSAWWWAILGLLAVAGYTLWQFAHTEQGGKSLAAGVLRVPVLGNIVLKREVAGYCRTLGELTRNGVPILAALEIAQRVLTNRVIAEDAAKVPESIAEGSGVAPALKESRRFPSVVVNMVAIGEETGRLPEALLKIATSYETQVDREVKTLTALLEPLIILVMGIVVGAIVISMLLPIFSLDPTAGQ